MIKYAVFTDLLLVLPKSPGVVDAYKTELGPTGLANRAGWTKNLSPSRNRNSL